jgi:hypothetical protein
MNSHPRISLRNKTCERSLCCYFTSHSLLWCLNMLNIRLGFMYYKY